MYKRQEQAEVEVRPLVQITGEAEFNELFIEEARIPHANPVSYTHLTLPTIYSV